MGSGLGVWDEASLPADPEADGEEARRRKLQDVSKSRARVGGRFVANVNGREDQSR